MENLGLDIQLPPVFQYLKKWQSNFSQFLSVFMSEEL